MTLGVVVLLSALGAGAGGVAVPWVIRRLPEPAHSEAAPGEDPKPLYVDVAARRGLAVGAAATSAVLAALVALVLGADPWLVAVVPVVPACVALAVVDWHTRLLPSRIVLAATTYAAVVALLLWPLTGDPDDLLRAAIGMVATWALYALLWFVYPAGMGYGDVRLAALIGLVLGHVGWAELLVGVYTGFLVFGLPGLLLALVRWDRKLLKTAFPFGPFMLVGALLGLLLGPWVAAGLGFG